jgi:hypothetical protein
MVGGSTNTRFMSYPVGAGDFTLSYFLHLSYTKSGLSTPFLVETRQKAVRVAFSVGVGSKAEEKNT